VEAQGTEQATNKKDITKLSSAQAQNKHSIDGLTT